MRVLGSVTLLAALSFGCGGGDPDPSVSGVFPSSAFLGRQVRVEVSGDVTGWSDNATVNFGEGITVDSVAVASPSALFAEITIADDAPPGLRDVTVTDGGQSLVLEASFELESAVSLQFRGNVAQGSLALFTIGNRDFFSPFDTTSTGDGLFTPLEFTNVQVTGPAGVRLQVGSVDAFMITGTAFFDVDAVPGPVSVHSGPDGEQIVSGLGVDLDVTPRAATALSAGTPAMGTVATAFDSQLYEFTPGAAPSVTEFVASSTDQRAATSFALLPASGKFDELLSFGGSAATVQETAGKLYLVYFDIDGGVGYNYSLAATSTTLTAQAEVEPNDTPALAKPTVPPSLVSASTLTAETDEDWYTFTTTAANIGDVVHVITGGADPFTDTVVEVFTGANCQNSLGGPSEDSGFHENHISAPIAAGTVGKTCVKISGSIGFFDPASDTYVAAIYLQ